jgi:uridine phosphorylase
MPSPVPKPETIHLRPHADVAERVLAPGDPGRALRLAQWFLDAPKMLNHHRGLWGYTGAAADGRPLTIQSTGLGGPSAAVVVEELVRLGARRLVRVGTGGALDPGLALGDLVVAGEVRGADGASRALGAPELQVPDAGLTRALAAAAGASPRPVVSADLFYDPDPERRIRWAAEGAVALDLEAAAVLAVAARRGVAAGCVLAVTAHGGARIGEDALAAAEQELGRVALAALADEPSAD